MSALRFESPLAWPDGIAVTPRNQQRNDHGFPAQQSIEESIALLDEELSGIGSGSSVLYLDIEQPVAPRLRKKVGSRSGACLHLKHQGKGYVLTCDRWQLPEHNIYALHLALRQLRSMERWGVGSLPVLLHGFEAERSPEVIAAAGDISTGWMDYLGLGPTATLEDAIAVYHRRAKQVARDSGALAQLNILMEEVREHFAGKS